MLAGYLPDEPFLREFQQDLQARAELARKRGHVHPRKKSVIALAELLERDGIVRMYVERMIEEVHAADRTVRDIPDLLRQLDHVLAIAPRWEEDEKRRNFFPLSSLFHYLMITDAGWAAFRLSAFNEALLRILREWCDFLDSPESRYVLNRGKHGWLSRPAREYNQLQDFVIPDRRAPHWGWSSWNDFFHREILPSKRPIAGRDDPRVVVSPNDGSMYRISRKVQLQAQFWVKGEYYSLENMLAGSDHTYRFVHGDVFQSYLSGADYHRFHAPVDGVVRQARIVDGLTFSNLEWAGNDIKGIKSQGYYTAVNVRGLTFIESADVGMVCVMPVGITEVSSITLTAQPGHRVRKGDQLGYFSYGGSSVAIAFEPDAIDHYTVCAPTGPGDDPVPIRVNAQIAVARRAEGCR